MKNSVTKNLVIVNLIVFLITLLFRFEGIELFEFFSLQKLDFHFYQLVTHQFLHAGLLHLVFNMIGLYTLGESVEHYIGTNFLSYYLICGVMASVCFLAFTNSTLPMVGASGAIYGLFGLSVCINPNQNIGIIFIPVGFKALNLAIFLILIEFLLHFTSSDNIAHMAHIGGFFTGVLIYFLHKFFFKQLV
jgi:membrane associated rhomboid family serine protease